MYLFPEEKAVNDMTDLMKAVVLARFGGADAFELRNVAAQVRILQPILQQLDLLGGNSGRCVPWDSFPAESLETNLKTADWSLLQRAPSI